MVIGKKEKNVTKGFQMVKVYLKERKILLS